MRNLSYINRIIISGGLSFVMFLSASCSKEGSVEPKNEMPIEFSAKESRLPQSNQYSVIVTLDCDRRSEWWNVAVTLDGKTRESLLREGRVFEESPSLIIPLGGLNNGKHDVNVALTDNRDNTVVRHISFHCIGDYTGEMPEYEDGLKNN